MSGIPSIRPQFEFGCKALRSLEATPLLSLVCGLFFFILPKTIKWPEGCGCPTGVHTIGISLSTWIRRGKTCPVKRNNCSSVCVGRCLRIRRRDLGRISFTSVLLHVDLVLSRNITFWGCFDISFITISNPSVFNSGSVQARTTKVAYDRSTQLFRLFVLLKPFMYFHRE